MKKRVRLKTLLVFMILCIAGGFFIAYKMYNPAKEVSVPWVAPDISNPSKKFIAKETLITQIQQKQELIPLEIDLTEKVVINDSWGKFEAFKKIQNVYFVGKGIYSVDLSKLSVSNVELDNNKGVINLSIPKPIVKGIVMDEKKTIYETVQTGLLRFGEIKLTTPESQAMLNEAKISMKSKMTSSELFDQAVKSSEWAIKDLIKSILTDHFSYNIVIEFKDNLL
jgi:hypothetical protein